MTREEAIGNFNMIRVAFIDTVTVEQGKLIDDTFRTAIKALRQEPCEDTISRQAVIDAFHTWFRDGFDEDKWWNSTHVLAAIEGIPSVHQKHEWETCFDCPLSHGCPKIKGCTNEQAIEYASKIPNDCPLSAQPKVGHWIFDEILDKHYYCSECKSMGVDYWDFCPNCGAKMVEPQAESEGKK